MEKPITIRREEFGQAVTEAINSSGLPAFVVADVLEDMIGPLRRLEAKQYADDMTAWKKEQEKKEAGEKKTETAEDGEEAEVAEAEKEAEMKTGLTEEEAEDNGCI